MDTNEELAQLYGEVVRIEAEIEQIKEAQIKPRQDVRRDLLARMKDCYMEKHQLKLNFDHGDDIVGE